LSESCPICGSKCVALSDSCLRDLACPRCGSKAFYGLVKERSFELALVDFTCYRCGKEWFDSCVLPEEFKVDSVIRSHGKRGVD
jgi:DNA-directed RNA polymerase subunit RPC12/RpoP